MNDSIQVLVTGASGFVASRIVEQLQAKSYRVRGTVRTRRKELDLAYLRALPGAADRLEFVEADLLVPGSFDAAAAGCTYVLHTASPYLLNVADPQRDLVDPAVHGTRNVLGACMKAGTVKRVVLTSSMAAVSDEPDSNHVLTERDWNLKSNLKRNPYYYSKTQAEKAAWEFMEREKPSFDLVVINPFMVIGPSLGPALNTSTQIFVDLLKGTYPGIMDLTWGLVDVRDVADAHIRAMETAAAKGRYICAGETVTMRKLVGFLAENGYGKGYRLPHLTMDVGIGTTVVRLASYFQPKGVGSYLRTHVGRAPRYDTTKIRTELGVTFRPVETSILDTVRDLERWGHLSKVSAN